MTPASSSPASVAFADAPPIRPPRDAATLLVVRDAAPPGGGLEVLMLKRVESANDFGSGAYVFPGGVVDADDRALHVHCRGLDDAAASARLALPAHGLDFYVAAIRECFEEAGLLFADDADGRPVDPASLSADEWFALRRAAHGGNGEFGRIAERLGLVLAVDRLAYLAHWLTPPGRKKRFDTRFFVALLPPGQAALHDARETVWHGWLRPGEAAADESLTMVAVTRRILQSIAHFPSAEACLAHARRIGRVERVMPRLGWDGDRSHPVLPSESAYAEIARLDPDGTGRPSRRIVPGVPVRLSPRVIRVTAPNAGVMTGPGTNTYLVGGGPGNDWAVLDPGPDDEAHVAAVRAAAPGPIRWILATHTHRDHSPGCLRLKAATGAPVVGRRPAVPQGHDETFAPDHVPAHGEHLAVGDATLRVLHTPGHASNHLCFLLEEEKLLFTGDHVMQGSTVVVNPPDGDMAAYLASLESLLALDLDMLAPGHGFLVGRPHDAIRMLLRHRRHREAKVVAVLRKLGPAPLADLVAGVYNDVPAARHGIAARSLLAHLLKLSAEGRARDGDGGWRWTGATSADAGGPDRSGADDGAQASAPAASRGPESVAEGLGPVNAMGGLA